MEFGEFGRLIAVRCPHDFDHLMRKAGGQWEPGSRRWLVERRRIGPMIRALEAATDPLFRRPASAQRKRPAVCRPLHYLRSVVERE